MDAYYASFLTKSNLYARMRECAQYSFKVGFKPLSYMIEVEDGGAACTRTTVSVRVMHGFA